MRRLGAVAVLIVLAACSSSRDEPSRAELEAIRQAQNVYPANYKADIMAFLRNYLNDPTGIRNAAVSQPQVKELPTGARYVACLRYEAKKAGGQYAGSRTALVVFISGKLDRFVEPPRAGEARDGAESGEGAARAGEVREACKDAVLAPFPELQHLSR